MGSFLCSLELPAAAERSAGRAVTAHFFEALKAVHRAAGGRFKRHRRVLAALGTSGGKLRAVETVLLAVAAAVSTLLAVAAAVSVVLAVASSPLTLRGVAASAILHIVVHVDTSLKD